MVTDEWIQQWEKQVQSDSASESSPPCNGDHGQRCRHASGQILLEKKFQGLIASQLQAFGDRADLTVADTCDI